MVWQMTGSGWSRERASGAGTTQSWWLKSDTVAARGLGAGARQGKAQFLFSRGKRREADSTQYGAGGLLIVSGLVQGG